MGNTTESAEKKVSFSQRHGSRPILPYLRGSIVGPALQRRSRLCIVGAVGAHDPDLNEPKEGDDKEYPWQQQQTRHAIDPSSSQQERREADKKKVDPVFETVMTMERRDNLTIIAGIGFTCSYGPLRIQI